MSEKTLPIIDVTAGSRMMWFDKNNPNVVFSDIRRESHVLCDNRVLDISPDIQADFTQLPFDDDTFHLVVFDPPHLEKLGQNSWMAKKYGVLSLDWKNVIKSGLAECMRILKPNGVLIFKWNEHQIKLKHVKPLFPCDPLFGHTTNRNGETIWVTFIKQ